MNDITNRLRGVEAVAEAAAAEIERLRGVLRDVQAESPHVSWMLKERIDAVLGATDQPEPGTTAYTRGFRDGFNTAKNHPPSTADQSPVVPPVLLCAAPTQPSAAFEPARGEFTADRENVTL